METFITGDMLMDAHTICILHVLTEDTSSKTRVPWLLGQKLKIVKAGGCLMVVIQ